MDAVMNWHVIYTKPGDEFRAHTNLVQQGFDPFLPLSKKPGDTKLRPLFSRYLFIPARRTMKPIHSTLGVLYPLKYGEELAMVAMEVINDIKQRIDPEAGAVLLKDDSPPRKEFKEGQKIRVIGGVYIGLEGLYVGRAKNRVIALLSMFGERKVRATVKEENVA